MKKHSSISFITWLRACSVVFILLCHYCSRCDHPFVPMLTMVFNIGVQLFFIMSGFLVGYKGIRKPYTAWYKKRIRRIYIPLWLFLTVLACVHMANGRSLLSVHWLLLALGLQGTVVHIWGAEQTWFISVLLLCYLLSPWILAGIRKVTSGSDIRVKRLSLAAVCAMPILWALFEEAWVYTVFTPVSLYILACAYGACYDPEKPFSLRKNLMAVLVIALSFGLRLTAKVFFDDTIFYDRIVVQYTQSVAAIAIVSLFEAFFSRHRAPKAIQFVSEVSFEIYLYHYMFVQGPIDVFGSVPNWGVGCIAVTAVVLPIAFLANRIAAALSGSNK